MAYSACIGSLGHCSTGIESDDAFVNGAFPFQVAVVISSEGGPEVGKVYLDLDGRLVCCSYY